MSVNPKSVYQAQGIMVSNDSLSGTMILQKAAADGVKDGGWGSHTSRAIVGQVSHSTDGHPEVFK